MIENQKNILFDFFWELLYDNLDFDGYMEDEEQEQYLSDITEVIYKDAVLKPLPLSPKSASYQEWTVFAEEQKKLRMLEINRKLELIHPSIKIKKADFAKIQQSYTTKVAPVIATDADRRLLIKTLEASVGRHVLFPF